MKKKLVLFSFLAVLFGLTLFNLLSPAREYSENENRYLAQMPEFSVSALFEGTYTRDFENFVTDQFVGRDKWVGAKTASEHVLLKQDSNGVYFGKDHYLIETFEELNHSRYTQNLRFVSGFSEKMKEKGVSVCTMLVPTAADILSEKLPKQNVSTDQQALLAEAKKVLPDFIDVTAVLEQHDKEEIYYRTDHHWTSLGAYYAYQEFLTRTGRTPHPKDFYQVETLSEDFLGTTFSKVGFYPHRPDVMESFFPKNCGELTVSYNEGKEVTKDFYERSHLEEKDKYSVYLNGNQPITEITTPNKNGKKLLLIKDSYANEFAQFAVGDYEQVFLVDLRFYKKPVSQLAEEKGITDLLVLYHLKGFSEDTNMAILK